MVLRRLEKEREKLVSCDKGLTFHTSAFQIFYGENSTFINSRGTGKSFIKIAWSLEWGFQDRQNSLRYGYISNLCSFTHDQLDFSS